VNGGCDTTLTWDAGAPYPVAVDHHVTFLLQSDGGAYLYVCGGNNYINLFATTYHAPIQSDGSLGDWNLTTPLPTPRAGHSAEVVGDQVFVISGQEQVGMNLTSVLVNQAGSDGTLGDWSATSELPFGRFHLASANYNGWIYVTGGLDNSFQSSADVLGAEVLPDGGGLSAWQTMTSLPHARDHHSSFAYAGHLYVVGGEYGNPNGNQVTPLNDVWWAPINADGTLGDWAKVWNLDAPEGLSTQANFVHEGWLYVLGGIELADGGQGVVSFADTTRVRRASIGEDGTIGAWEEIDPLPLARGHVHQTPVWSGHVYSVGGSHLVNGSPEVLSDVSIGLFQ
jgi:hypothetical protein